jgi:hypothetical protein
LADRTANRIIVVTLYETLADLEAGDLLFRQTLADPRFAGVLAEQLLSAGSRSYACGPQPGTTIVELASA